MDEFNVVIIHGLSSLKGEERLKTLIKKLKEEFPKAKIIVPNYLEKYQRPAIFTAGKKSIWEYAEDCKRIIEKEKREGPLFIVAFSLGGLIARVDVEQKGIEAHAVILVGTPNKGIKLNRWEKLILKILKRPAIEEMLPNSQFIRKLNEDYSKLQLKTRYYLIAGSKDKRVPIWSALGIEFIKSEGTFIGSTDHSGLIPKELKSTPTAIDIIIQILKREAGFQSASFLLEKM